MLIICMGAILLFDWLRGPLLCQRDLSRITELRTRKEIELILGPAEWVTIVTLGDGSGWRQEREMHVYFYGGVLRYLLSRSVALELEYARGCGPLLEIHRRIGHTSRVVRSW